MVESGFLFRSSGGQRKDAIEERGVVLRSSAMGVVVQEVNPLQLPEPTPSHQPLPSHARTRHRGHPCDSDCAMPVESMSRVFRLAPWGR